MNKKLLYTAYSFYCNNDEDRSRIKKLVSSIICYIERNLNIISYKIYGISDNFKNMFPFVSSCLSDDELKELIYFYKRIRGLNVHTIATNRKDIVQKDLHCPEYFDVIFEKYKFLEFDVPFMTSNRDLTLYGVFAILGLFLNNSQMRSYINLIFNERWFKLPKETLNFDYKNQLLNRLSNLSLVKDVEKDIPLVYCEEQFVIPIIAQAFLSFESIIIKKYNINIGEDYFSFKFLLSKTNIPTYLKNKLIDLRNMWAHGNCFYYKSNNDNTIIRFIDVMSKLQNSDFEYFANKYLLKLKIILLSNKYKRYVEMSIKLQQDRVAEESLVHRLKTMTNFKNKDELVPVEIENALIQIRDVGDITFSYRNKEEVLEDYVFKHVNIVEHKSLEGKNFVVEGFNINMSYFVEVVLQEYSPLKVSSSNGYYDEVIVDNDYQTHIIRNYR